ncbi:MAG: transcription termination factor Rho [Deltaproteobacteria bacterium RIFCSPLOWO2_01_44_7]|nr:MAG: transcription termination factor Rho [Deltaproteobacteria bacterium RIFCSPHIGHO2_01_FULL_43_49]OGQ15664.1 MAG: transcription termination factor Rho [Deltaproteobacteria bacterium RIFCSPHIGHO2_02_FULL_44_53]OGQ28633.1 MAG: transcription termination factor Rho [Deltaproteobacteria bacterium RIFCSPHIGHO2_12_FULL_44_21]OGQ31955.1 MAG: transcription termination factor Rho [Deltaproteobacteria bacterium RIFCSPLOWO2_01_FULL_45_74]OGQ43570.1 MAG: transcription termination factor Rho [Deltaprote
MRKSFHQQRPRHHCAPQARKSDALVQFLQKTSVDPHERLRLETSGGPLSMRIFDLISPIGKGQRGLIVAPPKTGKTTFLKEICLALAANHPEVKSYCLLIEERPEEVTDFTRTVTGEVVASSSDHDTEHHIQTANKLLERVIGEVNEGKDVLILVDSLTRLARVHNRDARSGKTLSGGMDANALEVPRRFFGAARKLEEGGSLTIIATALIDTGSRMDDYIFQEFKGTGNLELVLSRKPAEMRLFPAIDISASGTRKEEKLFTEQEFEAIHKVRSYLAGLNPIDALKKLIETLPKYPTNADFLKNF